MEGSYKRSKVSKNAEGTLRGIERIGRKGAVLKLHLERGMGRYILMVDIDIPHFIC